MAKQTLEIAKKRKEELFKMLKYSKDPILKKSIVKDIIILSKRFNLTRTKEEKELYCKYCAKAIDNKSKIRIEKLKKNKEKIIYKIIICGNCGKKQKIKLK
jgi:RNase P subunit RPR2